ncbi:MAG: phytanoyl-CoA dioxygenase [Alphaproteobacteria bacterium]|nr:MAG: phytanoyl-CoA dioxygenase [Alphaproteobacteria bacterium]
MNPALMGLLRKVMPSYFILNQSNGLINNAKQEYSQARYHRDLPYQHFTSDRPLAVNALFCVDEFTQENGGTRVVPGSHLQVAFPSDRYVQQHEEVIEAPRGSFLVLDAMTYHSGGANRSDRARRAINHVFTIPMMRQQISIARELADFELTAEERQLFGFGLEEPLSVEDFLEARIRKTKSASM